MGSWGVKAHESDYGLDLLAIAVDKYLRGVKFKTFHVKHIMELLRTQIIYDFVKESNGWEAHYIDFFYEYTFPYHFAHAVMLIVECFAEYHYKGKLLIYDHETGKNRRINEIIFTSADLETLRTELQSILNPTHGLYESWEDSDTLNEWQTHVKMLCDTISQAMSKGGDDDAKTDSRQSRPRRL